MIFKNPWVLLFIPVVAFGAYFFKKRNAASSIKFSSGQIIKEISPTLKILFLNNIIYLRAIVIVFFILALARPRMPLGETRIDTEGIDIVLAVDCSGSMLAEDFKVDGKRKNRLEVVKEVVKDFINKRHSDRIGTVAFAARAYTVCPLTTDYDWLIKNLERVEIGTIEDGTAIGSAISASLNRLKDTEAKSKIIILLTDGINNSGKISPLNASEAAKALGVKIYTIGAGTRGLVPYPAVDFFGRRVYQNVKIEIDEDSLKQSAGRTEAKYFRATDTESLKGIYKEIDSLEKTTMQESGFQEYNELFSRFLLAGLILLSIEIILKNTLLRRLP